MADLPTELAQTLLQRFIAHNKDHAVLCISVDHRVVAWLGAAQEILGYTQAEAIGQPAALIFTPEDRAQGMDVYELNVAASDSRAEDDRWHLRKDGTRIWVTGSVEAIRGDAGELLGYVKVLRDKTDLRTHIDHLENQLHEAQAVEKEGHVFLSTLGHELRNPLASLSAAAHILEPLSADPRAARAVEVVQRQVQVLTRLAEDLMDVSRSGAGKLQLERQPVDVRRMLDQAVFALQESATRKGVKLESLMPESPLRVDLDVDRFERVVLNLLGNALKYTDAGGSVWVKAFREGDEVLVRVEDTGIGIAAEMLPRIFELFTQERHASERVPGGLGLGLAVVKELVELHGGSVQARSGGRGKGAEFSVRLPLLAAQWANPASVA